MKRKFLLLAVSCWLIFVNGYAQKIATLEVQLNGAGAGLDVPVTTDLNTITLLPDTALSLV